MGMKTIVILFTLTFSVLGTPPHLWHRLGHGHLHRKKDSSTQAVYNPSISGSDGVANNATVLNESAKAVSTSTGTSFPSLSVPSAAGTAPIGTASCPTASHPSASLKPTAIQRNNSYLLASSGLGPKASNTVPITTANLHITTTAVAATATSSKPAASGSPCPDFLRGVNVGGWLLLDSVLNAKLLSAVDAVDQWTFDSLPGANSALQTHWDTYFDEASVQLLKSYGVNAIKIPIGYWAWDNSGTPYKQGADAYLEKAIGWAEAAGMKVWIDVSNADSGRTTTAEVSPDQAIPHSLSILTTVAKKYGSSQYANTVTAIEIFSSPVTSPATDMSALQTFAKQAFDAIKSASTNPNIQVVMPNAASALSGWTTISQSISPIKGMFSVAQNMLQTVTSSNQSMTQEQHIQAVCQRGYAMAGINHDEMSLYIGEFSAATTTTMEVEGWTDDVVQQIRKYVEAQLATYESYTSGYFLWSWADNSEQVAGVGWGIKDGIEKGYLPNPLNDPNQRKYPGQCDV
ncbi:MAG: hypothetical protein Q9163_005828 [Psora crenata]